MKTKQFLLSGALGIALAGFVLSGCHKDSTAADTDITAAQDESNATNISNDSKSVSDAAVQGNSSDYGPIRNRGVAAYSSHCTVTWNDTSSSASDTMYVNFGTTPVFCNDLRWREGEIIVYWLKSSGSSVWQSYFDSGSTVNMTFRNYARGNASTNMVEVNGTRSWTNEGGLVTMSDIDNVNWNFQANLTLTYLADGKTATWVSTRNNTLVNVGGYWYYEITGSGYGVSKSGNSYTVSITSPLYHTAFPWWLGGENGCPYIEAGSVQVNRTGKATLTITFGTVGTCSDEATATIDGHSYTFTMW
jgi:hypothetical protein